MQIVKTIAAGRWRFSVAYRKRCRTDSPKARAAKTQHSSDAQKLLNRKLSAIGATGIIALNFADNPKSRFITLTFDKAHYPATDKEQELYTYTEKQADLFLQRARRLCKLRGNTLKAFWFLGRGEGGRFHVHVITDAFSGEDLRALWQKGNVDYHYLKDRQDDPEKWDFVRDNGNVDPAQIAGYAIRNATEACPLGKHLWHATKSCERAAAEQTYEIEDNMPIPVPEESDIINEEIRRNDYSEFRVVEFILPVGAKVQISPDVGWHPIE